MSSLKSNDRHKGSTDHISDVFMLRILLLSLCLLLSGALAIGCQTIETATSFMPQATPSPRPTEKAAIQQPSTATSVPTQVASPTLPSTPSPTPTIEPAATPLPLIQLLVPPEWREIGEAALAAYKSNSISVDFRLTDDEHAPVRLVNELGEHIIKREAVALVVPFTSERPDLSYEEALTVMEQGHEQIEVMPWSEMPLGMRALRVDGRFVSEADYPLQEAWSLQAEAGYEEMIEELVPAFRAASKNSVVHLVAVGDIMLDRSLGMALENGHLDYPFAEVLDELRQADITIGNVESALGNVGEPVGKRYPFRAPPQAAESLARAGFDVVSLANNHAGDYGDEALLQAIELLQAQGVAAIGAGSNAEEAHQAHIEEVNGLTIAFLGYVNVPVEASTGFDTASWTASKDGPGIAWADPIVIQSDIAAIADTVDLIVVALHSGFEYQAPPSEPQIAAARAAIEAGADLVIGHHAHILQGIEFYEDGVIVYGTGNFAFEIDGPPETATFDIWLDKDGVREIAINPAIIQFGGQPRMAESWEAPAIRNRVYYLTDILNAN